MRSKHVQGVSHASSADPELAPASSTATPAEATGVASEVTSTRLAMKLHSVMRQAHARSSVASGPHLLDVSVGSSGDTERPGQALWEEYLSLYGRTWELLHEGTKGLLVRRGVKADIHRSRVEMAESLRRAIQQLLPSAEGGSQRVDLEALARHVETVPLIPSTSTGTGMTAGVATAAAAAAASAHRATVAALGRGRRWHDVYSATTAATTDIRAVRVLPPPPAPDTHDAAAAAAAAGPSGLQWPWPEDALTEPIRPGEPGWKSLGPPAFQMPAVKRALADGSKRGSGVFDPPVPPSAAGAGALSCAEASDWWIAHACSPFAFYAPAPTSLHSLQQQPSSSAGAAPTRAHTAHSLPLDYTLATAMATLGVVDPWAPVPAAVDYRAAAAAARAAEERATKAEAASAAAGQQASESKQAAYADEPLNVSAELAAAPAFAFETLSSLSLAAAGTGVRLGVGSSAAASAASLHTAAFAGPGESIAGRARVAYAALARKYAASDPFLLVPERLHTLIRKVAASRIQRLWRGKRAVAQAKAQLAALRLAAAASSAARLAAVQDAISQFVRVIEQTTGVAMEGDGAAAAAAAGASRPHSASRVKLSSSTAMTMSGREQDAIRGLLSNTMSSVSQRVKAAASKLGATDTLVLGSGSGAIRRGAGIRDAEPAELGQSQRPMSSTVSRPPLPPQAQRAAASLSSASQPVGSSSPTPPASHPSTPLRMSALQPTTTTNAAVGAVSTGPVKPTIATGVPLGASLSRKPAAGATTLTMQTEGERVAQALRRSLNSTLSSEIGKRALTTYCVTLMLLCVLQLG
jgi:hypothetical protein